jgi:hypothetical protein
VTWACWTLDLVHGDVILLFLSHAYLEVDFNYPT